MKIICQHSPPHMLYWKRQSLPTHSLPARSTSCNFVFTTPMCGGVDEDACALDWLSWCALLGVATRTVFLAGTGDFEYFEDGDLKRRIFTERQYKEYTKFLDFEKKASFARRDCLTTKRDFY